MPVTAARLARETGRARGDRECGGLALCAGSRKECTLVAVTPGRTPAPNELEYLDVFDFFNMPRLPVSLDGPIGFATATANDQMQIPDGATSNEFNITNFMVDASSDWFMKNTT